MIVTLLTDFGIRDHYVAAMKAVILRRVPELRLVDISHQVAPGAVAEAAFLLACCYHEFPAGTVHLVVVDPGVGSQRRAVTLRAGGHYFVGPDNGVFGFVLAREPAYEMRSIEAAGAVAGGISTTFHGRDVFAPVAARLAAGEVFEAVGPPATSPAPLLVPTSPDRLPGDLLRGTILHIDRFGNCVTNLRPADFGPSSWESYRFLAAGHVIDRSRLFYAEGGGSEPFMILGSAGLLEISINGASAATELGCRVGTAVTAEPRDAGPGLAEGEGGQYL